MSAIDITREAFRTVQAARAQVTAEKVKLEQLQLQQANENAERLELREVEDGDAARRIIDGPNAAPEKPRRRNKLAKLDANAPGLAAAIELQGDRIGETEARLDRLLIPLAAASLHLVSETQGDALAAVRSALAQLAEPAARLLACDQLLAATVGVGSFAIPSGAPVPINGARLLDNILPQIPDSIRPVELQPEVLAKAARAIAQPIIADLKGPENEQ